MRNFQQLASGIDVLPLLHAVTRQKELWDTQKLRTTHTNSPHTQVNDILLRFIDIETVKGKTDPGYVLDQHESINYPAFFQLPEARPIIYDLMRRVEGQRLGRVIITRLSPGKKIDPHIDSGDHAAYYDRYHCILQNQPGSLFRTGNETVCMKTGDVWWFDNSIEHEVINNSEQDRLTMIIDIRTSK